MDNKAGEENTKFNALGNNDDNEYQTEIYSFNFYLNPKEQKKKEYKEWKRNLDQYFNDNKVDELRKEDTDGEAYESEFNSFNTEERQRQQWEINLVKDLKSVECDVIFPYDVTDELRDECVLLDVMNYGDGECCMFVDHKIDHEGFSIQCTAKHLNKLRVGLAIRFPCDGTVSINQNGKCVIKGKAKFGAWHGIVKTVYPDGAVGITKYNFGKEEQNMILDKKTFDEFVKGVNEIDDIFDRLFDNHELCTKIKNYPADQSVKQELQKIRTDQIKEEESWEKDPVKEKIYDLKQSLKRYKNGLQFYEKVREGIAQNPSVYSFYCSEEEILGYFNKYEQREKESYLTRLRELEGLEKQRQQQQKIYSQPQYIEPKNKQTSSNSFTKQEENKQQQQQEEGRGAWWWNALD